MFRNENDLAGMINRASKIWVVVLLSLATVGNVWTAYTSGYIGTGAPFSLDLIVSAVTTSLTVGALIHICLNK